MQDQQESPDFVKYLDALFILSGHIKNQLIICVDNNIK
ncbi:hypothetical protein DFP81_102172 [Marinomonas pollencensis]|uniref:Uncharacterized protein n=1 Tax=Marinomonas pollencensis TaxID=491954 RepID=A0A3E0DVG7_9GAMM|nr:hypothetical protein DFP81_102172 [Marinomonas pollencensis]